VVDGGSTDRSREIAGRYTSHILITENAPAETQRLKGLEKISHDWFFLLDADERISDVLRKQIEAILNTSESKRAYYVLRRNLYRERPVHLHHPDYQLRLFKKAEMKALPERIHRLPQIKSGAGKLEGVLTHYFFTTFEEYFKKLNRYTGLEASYWKEEGRDLRGWKGVFYLTVRPLGRFLQYYFFKGGFQDGVFGFFYSAASAYYEFAVAARILSNGDTNAP
jgi:glycosyltransferase involved in cell wall biosynthesis